MITTILWIAVVIFLGYILYLSAIFCIQDKLLFSSPKKQYLLYEKYAENHVELIINNIYIQGWRITGENQLSSVVVLYFGGNAEDVVNSIETLRKIPAKKLYTFNYRGYGLSQGIPSEKTIYSDALHIYDRVKNYHPETKIIVIGYSLGSAIAGYVAQHKKCDYLILLAPIESIITSARDRFGKLIPEIIVKNTFNLSNTAAGIYCDSLVILAGKDAVIKNSQSLTTYAALVGKKQLLTIQHATHTNLLITQEALNAIAEAIYSMPLSNAYSPNQNK